MLECDEQIATRHFVRLREAEEKKYCRSDIGENPVLDPKASGVFSDIDEMDQVGGMRGVGRSIGIPHLLTVAVIGRDEAGATLSKNCRDDSRKAGINSFDRLDPSGNDARMADHVGVRQI